MILEVSDSQVLISLFGSFLNIIHIAVPILLIIFVTIDLIKAVASQDNEQISRTVHSIKNRIIACLAIFFLPTIVEIMFSKVFISLNVDESEYNKILSTYHSVINSKNIKVEDDSKSTEIKGNLMYSIADNNKDVDKQAKNEKDFSSLSKNMTEYLFKNDSFKILLEPVVDDEFSINYKDNKYTLSSKLNINYDSLTLNETIDDGNYIVSNVTLNNASVNNSKEKATILLSYYYKKDTEKDNYKLYKINLEEQKKVEEYIETVKSKEAAKDIISSEKYISNDTTYDYSKLDKITDSKLKEIINKNRNNMVLLSTKSSSATINRATGFLIRNGVIATSWSYFGASLMNGQTIIVSDVNRKTYKINGVVAIDTARDIVVLKLDKEMNGKVTFDVSNNLSKNDPVVAITSKTGIGFTTVTGIVSSNSDSLINVLPLSKNDWGSPVFNSNGSVVGINTAKILDKEFSTASKTENLKTLQDQLLTTKFNDIKTTSLEALKTQYFYKDKNKEQISKNIPDKIWKKYKKIGNIENNIILDLVKANYYDKAVSLRYQNTTYGTIDNMEYASDFMNDLKNSGYREVTSSETKKFYKKGTKKVIIISEFDYLIIVLVKGGIL